jgi:MATE family multidrug resistance protein
VYLQIRLLSAPAVFTTLVGFGALRGAQDMRVPSVVAVAINAFNIVLDYPLIFGLGPIPAMGVAGAALASTLSQYIGAAWLLAIVVRRFGFERPSRFEEVRELFSIGGNLFLRTGLLTVFLLVATRVANRISPEAGAAHQVVRQVYIFTALVLDAFAVSTQSLVGYFVGAGQVGQARRAASLSIWWSLGSGVLLAAGMVLLTDATIRLMVPAAAVAVFGPAWIVSAIAQPLNALAFSTDGVHMGTGDYGYLRNGMFAATLVGVAWLLLIPVDAPGAFTQVWWATGAWVVVRAGFGLVRVYWHPAGRAPLTAAAAGD